MRPHLPKIFRLWFFLAGLSLVVVNAQINPTLDGRIWQKMRHENKYYFLTGYFAGLNKAESIIDLGVNSQMQREFGFVEPFYVNQMRQRIKSYLPDDKMQDTEMLVESLNLFYSDRYNLKIPVEVALRIVLARARGEVEQAEFWLNEARRSTIAK